MPVTAKQLKSRGWTNKDINLLDIKSISIKDIEYLENEAFSAHWNKTRAERREEQHNKKQKKLEKDLNIIYNGGLWISPQLNRESIKLYMSSHTKSHTTKLATARHCFTHYDDVIKQLKHEESKELYKKEINGKLVKMFSWLIST